MLAGVSLATLGGCTNLASFSAGELPVAPGSPVALAVEDAIRNPGPFPTFADVPKIPANAPDPKTRAQAEESVRAEARALETQVAAFGPIDPQANAALAARAQAIFAGIQPPTDAELAEIDAFARAARARATPPPPPR